MINRPGVHEYFLRMAFLASTRSTCIRRRVGCVLVDKFNYVIGTGYNGLSRGEQHCTEIPCEFAHGISGTPCNAIHAEQNALLQCKDITSIYATYCTASPCKQCIRLLLNTSCKLLIFGEEYPHSESKKLWVAQGRKWIHLNLADVSKL